MARTRIFISYSHEDERWRQRIARHLAVLAMEGIVEVWDDRRLEAGDDWAAEIDEQMASARIALLLVSSAFLTSKFIREREVPKIFERHEQAGMTIYPLLIKPCPWQEVGWLARMQIRPLEGKPVASFKGAKVDEVLVAAALEISSIARGKAGDGKASRASRPGEEQGANASGQQEGDISGKWEAQVEYDWPNACYTETFDFDLDGEEVFGTASFMGSSRGLSEGRLTGNRLSFITKTKTALGNEPIREEIHRYRGKVQGEEIRFVMQTEGGFSDHVPVSFVARRGRGK